MILDDKHAFSNRDLALLARARASFSDFLGAHLLNLPDEPFIERMRSPKLNSFLIDLAHAEESQTVAARGGKLMLDYLVSTRMKPAAELISALRVDRTRIFRGLSSSLGPPPPYEGLWQEKKSSPTGLLESIAKTYDQNDLLLSPDVHERVDYLGVEIGFLRHLAQAEVEARAAGDQSRGDELLKQQSRFFKEHLITWVPRFVEKALEYAKTDFYRGYLQLLHGFLLDEEYTFSLIAADGLYSTLNRG